MKLYHVNYGAPIGWVQVLAEGPSQAATHNSILHLLNLHGRNVVYVEAAHSSNQAGIVTMWEYQVIIRAEVERVQCTVSRNV